MANTRSAAKRSRQTQRRALRNRSVKAHLRSLQKPIRSAPAPNAERQRQTPMKFARSFQRSIKRLSAGSFIATQPSVARRGSIGRSARQNNANRHLGQSCGRIENPGRMLVRLIGLQRDLVFQPSARLVPPRPFGRALARIGESSRSIVAALMFASFSLSGKASAPYSFS